MGTNFYLYEKPKCEHCGQHQSQPKHIGKSSAGWCFSLHVIPEEGIHDLPDWERLWSQPGAWIEDEYGERVSIEDMYTRIAKRKWDRKSEAVPIPYRDWQDFHDRNHSMPGPEGLMRHRLDRYCVKHGAGTWDCLVGEYS